MKLNKTTRKVVAISLSLITLQSALLPNISYALTSGPSMPEYSSFEPVDATDMVNLFTGDMTYNMPLLTVPSPEGGYPLSLAYHAGIELNEEASWVGLGWTLNPGAISRSTIVYPDDYKGSIISSHFNDPGGSGFSIGGGYGPWGATATYDSEKGWGGSINLGAGLDSPFHASIGTEGVGVGIAPIGTPFSAGVSLGKDGTVSVHSGISRVAGNFNLGMSLSSQGLNTESSFFGQDIGASAKASANPGDYSVKRFSIIIPIWNTHFWLSYSNYKYYLDVDKTESAYGMLYYQNAPHTSTSYTNFTTPDNHVSLEFYQKSQGGNDANNANMVTYSPDIFTVAGQGISGAIRPYRATNGSVAVRNEPTGTSAGQSFTYKLFPGDQKPEFRYIGEPSNDFSYHYHPADDFLIRYTTSSGNISAVANTAVQNDPPNDSKQNNGRLASGKYIEWFSNKELLDASTPLVADPLTTEQRERFPDDGIGAIRITNTDGTVYTYAIPVYNTFQLNYSQHHSQPSSNSYTRMDIPYAYTWLLTSVNGSDYIDRGDAGKFDKNDWGYWVRFDYGKWTDFYKWQSPYEWPALNMHDDNQSVTFGNKQIYYLNRIVTRTHTALFVKDLRDDGKGASTIADQIDFSKGITDFQPLNGGISLGSKLTFNSGDIRFEKHIAASLMKLSKILLFKNEDLPSGTLESSGVKMDSWFPDFHYEGSNHTDVVGSLASNYWTNFTGIFESNNLHLYDNVLDVNDMSGVDLSKSLKTIDFTTDYSLCPGVSNNFNTKVASSPTMGHLLTDGHNTFSWPVTGGGKLTLKAVSVKGYGGATILPSTKFDYAINPPYGNNDHWDGWGMYSSDGTSNKYSHSTIEKGDAWSLTKIITPLGGEINVSYERDTYSRVISNEPSVGTEINLTGELNWDSRGTLTAKTGFKCSDFLKVGDPISYGGKYNDPDIGKNQVFNIEGVITAVTETNVSFSPNFYNTHTITSAITSMFSIMGIDHNPRVHSAGGNLRVSNISSRDELNNSYSTEYIYTTDGTKSGESSGIASSEPEFILGYSPSLELNAISPMVGYSKVTVSSEGTNNLPKTGKTVYEFNNVDKYSDEITNKGHDEQITLQEKKDVMGRKVILSGWLESDRSAFIGSAKTIQTYNNSGLLLNSQAYNYFEELPDPETSPIGTITEGVNLHSNKLTEAIKDKKKGTLVDRILRTTRISYPCVLKSVTTTQEGITSTQTNTAFDFYTGNVTESETNNSLLEHYKTKSVPAYTKYAGMGSKFADPANKNMLGQETANYFYSVDGSTDKLLSASVQTWKKDAWNYNEFVTDHYEDLAPTSESEKVWRKHQEYVWKSPVNQDGTVSSFTDFSWTSVPDDGWQKTNEITRYDHYSKPLESVDIKGTYSANKIGFNNSYVLANSGTSNYRSFTYTGFEDIKEVAPGKFYFGGEVYRNTGEQVGITGSVKPHTGKYMARIPTAGDYGPIYASGDIQKGKTYRGSAWVHKDSDPSTRIAAQLGGSNGSGAILIEQYMSIADPKAITVGDWKLLTVNIQVPADYVPTGGAINDLRIFVSKNPGGVAAYVDDMRLQPVNSPVTGYVWDEQRGLLTAILDNENFATLFTYDEAGRLVKTEKETINGIKKVSETEYHYGRL